MYSCKGSFGGCQGQPSARPWHLLIVPWAYSPSLLIGSSLPLQAIAYPHYHIVLFHRLSCARLACSLPYTWAILPHIRTDPTPFRVVAGSKPRASPSSNFTILHFLPRTIAYAAEQLHQQASGRSHPHNGIGIRIRSSTLPRTIAYAAEQLHQQTSGRSHPHTTVG